MRPKGRVKDLLYGPGTHLRQDCLRKSGLTQGASTGTHIPQRQKVWKLRTEGRAIGKEILDLLMLLSEGVY